MTHRQPHRKPTYKEAFRLLSESIDTTGYYGITGKDMRIYIEYRCAKTGKLLSKDEKVGLERAEKHAQNMHKFWANTLAQRA